MNPLWREVHIKMQQGFTWLTYFVRDNPVYLVVVFGVALMLGWLILKPEIKQK